MDVVLSTAYWPNLHYFYYVFNSSNIFIEAQEHYQKQSFRNRTTILSANGVLDLSIPVKKIAHKQFTSETEICYKEAWQSNHWRAITSAYRNSPYFEFFEMELYDFYKTEHRFLLEYNTQQLKTVFRILKMKKEITYTSSYENEVKNCADLREVIHPKKKTLADEQVSVVLSEPYYQTFGSKFGFTPNLSILDLLLNKGLETVDYFKW
ncbi:MAG: WbqC family protein [Bacteroidetes bacterium]|nr:WbqC family protein [Bacteroidota bacterium]